VKTINLPIVKNKVCVVTLRKSCEHTCFFGALIDLLGSMSHLEWTFVVLAGKLAFVLGALAVYLMHFEEQLG
jgi:hypothetical protein